MRRVPLLLVALLVFVSLARADKDPRWILKGHTDTINAVAFAPDNKTFATGGSDDTILLWNMESGKTTATLKGHDDSVIGLAFSPDGKTLASASEDKTVKIWDLAASKVLFTLKGHTDSVNSVAFSPDGKWLASGSDDETIIIWDVATGKQNTTLKGHTDAVNSVAFSADGKWLASGSSDDTVRLWDTSNYKSFDPLKKHTDVVNAVRFSADSKWLASGGNDGNIILWDVTSRKDKSTTDSGLGTIYSLAFGSGDKSLAVAGTEKMVKVFKLDPSDDGGTLSNPVSYTGHSDWINELAISSDGKFLLTGSDDETLRVWELPQLPPMKSPDFLGLFACFTVRYLPYYGPAKQPHGLSAKDPPWLSAGRDSSLLLHRISVLAITVSMPIRNFFPRLFWAGNLMTPGPSPERIFRRRSPRLAGQPVRRNSGVTARATARRETDPP